MKQTLILLHGGLGNSQSLKEIENYFSKTWRVFNIDFPGHGDRVEDNVRFSIDLFTDHLHSLILENNIDEPVVFGYSMGGYVALNHALKHPGIIRKIITYGTKLSWNPDEAKEQVRYLDPDKIREKVPEFASMLEARHGVHWDHVVSHTAEFITELGEEPSICTQTAVYVNTPAWLLRGSEDWMVTKKESERFISCAPNATYIEIEGLPHEIERVDTAILCRKIEELL